MLHPIQGRGQEVHQLLELKLAVVHEVLDNPGHAFLFHAENLGQQVDQLLRLKLLKAAARRRP